MTMNKINIEYTIYIHVYIYKLSYIDESEMNNRMHMQHHLMQCVHIRNAIVDGVFLISILCIYNKAMI